MSVFVKICGITNESDALLAVALGADALGFIFAPSKRQVNERIVSEIVHQLPASVLTFGVFVNERPEEVAKLVNRIGLSGAQLHGNEGPTATNYVSDRVRYVIKSFPAGHSQLRNLNAYRIWATLVDSSDPGSGSVFDWSLVEGMSPERRMLLAGGLNAENVAVGIERVRPFGVDVATGVEASPGKKDPTKLRAFIKNAKAVEFDEQDFGHLNGDLTEDTPYNWEESD